MTPLEILKKQFGYDAFRLNQEDIINSVLAGKDTFVLIPTGGGKSLCYQIPALLLEGVTLVVSPLIALMKDQVDALRVNGIAAAYLNSTLTFQQQEKVIALVRQNKIKLLYLAPERLFANENRGSLLDQLPDVKISLIAIDEAHCISQWGHDFRPDYLILARVKKSLPKVPVIALTATADKLTRKDILEKLELDNPNVFTTSFNRANIRYIIEDKMNSVDRLMNFLSQHKDESGIIYCLSRRSTETLAEDLRMAGFNALPYHAGMDTQTRISHQDKFLKDEVKLIVATIAFGMGIDKSNVRFVVHMDIPKNIEGYYQETGRAGRDGLDSIALMFYSRGDISKMKRFAIIEGNPEQTAISLRKLDQIARFAELEACRRKFLLNYFDEATGDYCGNCDICLRDLETYDATTEGRKVLKAVSELSEKFGAGYIIDVLWGSTSNRIQPEHKRITSYATGNAMSKTQWQGIIAGMVTQNFLEKTKGAYPILKLTEKGLAALESNSAIILTRGRLENEALNFDKAANLPLVEELKAVRRKLAAIDGVPPFVVLSDASLEELATYLPLTREQLLNISGFGETKVRKFGDAFLTAIASYCNAAGLESKIHLKERKIVKRSNVDHDTSTKQVTLKLFQDGLRPEEIAVKRKLSISTIEGHLAFYIKTGKISIQQVLQENKIITIEKVVNDLGSQTLTPIKLALGEAYSFSEIRYVIAHMQRGTVEEPLVYYGHQSPGDVVYEDKAIYQISTV
ncbi:MAG TPA: DNA helicase RecQ [Chryseosolibacter sp.]